MEYMCNLCNFGKWPSWFSSRVSRPMGLLLSNVGLDCLSPSCVKCWRVVVGVVSVPIISISLNHRSRTLSVLAYGAFAVGGVWLLLLHCVRVPQAVGQLWLTSLGVVLLHMSRQSRGSFRQIVFYGSLLHAIFLDRVWWMLSSAWNDTVSWKCTYLETFSSYWLQQRLKNNIYNIQGNVIVSEYTPKCCRKEVSYNNLFSCNRLMLLAHRH